MIAIVDDAAPKPQPYASWVSFVSGLVALGCSLYVLLSGDVIELLKVKPVDHPLLMAALVQGIIGTIAGIIALARQEPKRLAVIALSISIVAIIAKFMLAALAVAVVVALAMAIIAAVH